MFPPFFYFVKLISKANIITAKTRIMDYQMSIKSPWAAYSRISSELSVENTPDAIQEPLAPRGDSQLHHRVPHSPFYIILLKPFLRWLGTLAFTASIYGTLHNYERKGSFSPSHKMPFNVITTALILGLGLNLFVSRSSAPSAARGY